MKILNYSGSLKSKFNPRNRLEQGAAHAAEGLARVCVSSDRMVYSVLHLLLILA